MDPLVPNQVRYRTAPHSEDVIILRRGAKVNDACVGCGNRGCGLVKPRLSMLSMGPRVREDDGFTVPDSRLRGDLVCDAAGH